MSTRCSQTHALWKTPRPCGRTLSLRVAAFAEILPTQALRQGHMLCLFTQSLPKIGVRF